MEYDLKGLNFRSGVQRQDERLTIVTDIELGGLAVFLAFWMIIFDMVIAPFVLEELSLLVPIVLTQALVLLPFLRRHLLVLDRDNNQFVVVKVGLFGRKGLLLTQLGLIKKNNDYLFNIPLDSIQEFQLYRNLELSSGYYDIELEFCQKDDKLPLGLSLTGTEKVLNWLEHLNQFIAEKPELSATETSQIEHLKNTDINQETRSELNEESLSEPEMSQDEKVRQADQEGILDFD